MSDEEVGLDTDSRQTILLSKLLSRALNKNQLLLLDKISKNSEKTITALIEFVFKETGVPISTLKLNASVLKELDLIKFSNGDPVKLTSFGVFVFSLFAQSGVMDSTVGCKANLLKSSIKNQKQRPTSPCSNQGSGTGLRN